MGNEFPGYHGNVKINNPRTKFMSRGRVVVKNDDFRILIGYKIASKG